MRDGELINNNHYSERVAVYFATNSVLFNYFFSLQVLSTLIFKCK